LHNIVKWRAEPVASENYSYAMALKSTGMECWAAKRTPRRCAFNIRWSARGRRSALAAEEG